MKCGFCGKEIPDNSAFCAFCGRKPEPVPVYPAQETKKQSKAPVIILSVLCGLLVLTVGVLSVKLYGQKETAATQAALCESKIEEAETLLKNAQNELSEVQGDLEKAQKTVAEQKNTIKELNNEVAQYKADTDYIRQVRTALKKGNTGVGSRNFKVSQGVVVLALDGPGQDITLTTVSSCTVNYSRSGTSALLSFTENTWYGDTTTLRITPLSRGITTYHFSNTAGSSEFDVIIIVI